MSRRGPGEGSIYERWDGRWAGSVHFGYEDGRRVRKHVMGHTRAEVKDKMAALMRAHDEKRPIPDQRMKLGPFLRRWLDEVAKPNIRASTRGDHHPLLPGRSGPGEAAGRALPRPAPLCGDVPAGAGYDPRGRQEPARTLDDRADLQHLRARAGSAEASGGGSDERGAGRPSIAPLVIMMRPSPARRG